MNDVAIPYSIVLLLVSGAFSWVRSELDQQFAPECTSWNGIKKQLEDADKIGCTIINDCAGLNCSGQYQGHDVKAEVVVEPCEKPPKLNTTFDIPSLNIHNMNTILTDGEQYQLPRIMDELNLFVQVFLKKKNQTILLSVILKPQITIADTWLPTVKLLENATIAVPRCSSDPILVPTPKPHLITSRPVSKPSRNITTYAALHSTAKKCDPTHADDCGENELCVEVSDSVSECRCRADFARSDNQKCVPELSLVGKKCNMTDLEHASCDKHEVCLLEEDEHSTGFCYCEKDYHDAGTGVCVPGSPSSAKEKTFVIVVACVVPILVLLLCGVAFFLAFKFRLVPRLRERFTNVRTYEVMSIGNDDDDEPLVA